MLTCVYYCLYLFTCDYQYINLLQESLRTSCSPPPTPDNNDTLPISRPIKRKILDDNESSSDLVVTDDVASVDGDLNPRKRFQKIEDDDIPLPDPFPLPRNY